jgi:hypothetical protein
VITDDGTLIVAETFGARFTAFTIADDGALTDRRIWAQVEPTPEPRRHGDDARRRHVRARRLHARRGGHIWAANALAGALPASRPAARSSRRSRCPTASACFACQLGGEDGRTLVACAAPDFHEEARKAASGGGAARDHRRRPARGPAVGQLSSAASTSAATSAAVAGGSGGSP